MTKTYLYIDESGDPSIYASGKRCLIGTEGFKPLLLVGMVKIQDKAAIGKAILHFMEDLRADPLYSSLPCINNPKGWYLHASYDNLELQIKFIDFLRKLDGFKFYCVIGRKRLDLFHKKHNGNDTEFYFDMVYHLLKDRLNDENSFFQILLSARNKNTQRALVAAVNKAIDRDNAIRKNPVSVQFNCEIVQSRLTPELSIVDYMLWALQRYILQREKRFYNALQDKYNLIIDLYDFEKNRAKGNSNYYHKKNRFTIENAGEFRTDGYVEKQKKQS